jgi:hypothetical protein
VTCPLFRLVSVVNEFLVYLCAGIPMERCSRAIVDFGSSVWQCITYPVRVWQQYRRGLPSPSNNAGYEAVVTSSQHGDNDGDIEAAFARVVDNPLSSSTSTAESRYQQHATAAAGVSTDGKSSGAKMYSRDVNSRLLASFEKKTTVNSSNKTSSSTKSSGNNS